MRVFCTATELNAHKQSPCERAIEEQSNPMVQSLTLDADTLVETLKRDSHPEFDSMVSQMEMLNGPFAIRKNVNSEYECEICGKLFNKKYNMTKHRIIHSDDYPFECVFCRKM